MKKITIALTCLLAVFSSTRVLSQNKKTASYFQMQSGLIADVDYIPQTVIIKLKPEFRDALQAGRSNSVTGLLTDFKVNEVAKKYNIKSSPAMRQVAGIPSVDLSLIYEFKIDATVEIEEAINKLYATGMLEYAELNYLSHLDYVPNDPMIPTAGQYALRTLHAMEAWDIVKSDSTVIVGICDTGTALKHRDLKDNIKKNWADPVNGVDDDGDGFIDNFQGYDLGQGDNNTQVVASAHGSHVTACAVAQTNNGTGLAAPGFNSLYIPVKVSDSAAVIVKGYEGIVYAVDHGAQIINCSWGQNVSSSQSQQDAITYATGKGALVVGSAGNFGNSTLNYPSSYQYVLSVGNTDSMDVKSTSSNYGPALDLCAPGSKINSAIAKDTFMVLSGTSMAAGIATGCAALVKARFPWYNGLQIGEQLKATTDDIISQGQNAVFYKGKLGTGRINLYRAVTETPPMISMPVINKTDNNGDNFTDSDTLEISGTITNFLDTAHVLKATLRCSSSYVTILDSTVNVGQLNTLDTTDNYADPFTVFVKPGAPTTTVTFQLVFTDSNYVGYQTFTVQLKSSVSISENNVQYSMLEQNHPNPAGAFTTIDFQLAASANVNLSVYDVTGREVETIVEAMLAPGQHSYTLSTENLTNGVYYYSLRSGDLIETRKMVVLKK